MANPQDIRDSNTRLCDIFEMVVSRLDSLEAKLDLQKTVAPHADSIRPLGQRFSGMNLTGQCVSLDVHHSFDSHGVMSKAQAIRESVMMSRK